LCKPVEMCSSKSLDNLISLDVEDKDRRGAIVERGNDKVSRCSESDKFLIQLKLCLIQKKYQNRILMNLSRKK
jgi:hypothetical protein